MLYQDKCSKCHNDNRIMQAIKSPDQWQATINKMRQKDTNWISQEEAQTIATYLASNILKKDLNGHDHSKHSLIPTYLPKLFGFITFSLLLITVALGFFMTHGKRTLFKIHKLIAYTTFISAIIHGILIFITH